MVTKFAMGQDLPELRQQSFDYYTCHALQMFSMYIIQTVYHLCLQICVHKIQHAKEQNHAYQIILHSK